MAQKKAKEKAGSIEKDEMVTSGGSTAFGRSIKEKVAKILAPRTEIITSLKPKVVADDMIALFALPEIARVHLHDHGLNIRKANFTVDGIRLFMAHNHCSNEDFKDAIFGIIMVTLINMNIIDLTSAEDYTASEKQFALISEARIVKYKSLARDMIVVTMHAVCDGSAFTEVKWYDSFVAVKGNFLAKRRFETIIKLICTSDRFPMIFEIVTLNELVNENNVLKYRLLRLSTPSLIRKAIELCPYMEVLRGFDPVKLALYRQFDESGLLAQIAAGPLSQYCKGNIDPLTAKSWPKSATVSDLKRIPEAPYDARTIIRAKMVLDIVGFKYGNWYQGNKAIKEVSIEDTKFREHVDAVVKKVMEKQKNVDTNTYDNSKITERSLADKEVSLSQVIAEWMTSS